MQRFLIELFVRGVVLCLLTAIALGLLRRSAAAYRHLMCVLALLVLPMLPLMQRLMPTLPLLPARSGATFEGATIPPGEADQLLGLNRKSAASALRDMPQKPIDGIKPSTLITAESGSAAHGTAALKSTDHRELSRNVTAVLFAIWGVGVAILLARLLVALVRLRGLEAHSRTAMLDSVPIRVSEQVQTPLTWGIRRSVILLPAALLTGDRTVCDSALRHEQAHIARWDWMWNLLAELVCAFCWFQPGAWWLRSRMRLESERACDDRVLLSGVAGPDYAAHLLEIVRSVYPNEVAPAMAQSGEMEERMRHILDAAKPRHAQTKGLAASASFALALLSLAALRVSARPVEAKLQVGNGATTRKLHRAASRRTKLVDLADKPGATDGPRGNASPAATLDNASPAVILDNVRWGKAVDGLEPGLLLTTSDLSKHRSVPFNSHVAYKVLVRNTTERERVFEFQCANSGPPNSVSYLIPNDALRDALSARVIPAQFRALGAIDLATVFSAYAVKLAPGEAVVVPGEFDLYIGDADKQSYPRVEAIKAGMNWILQPITIRRLSDAEVVQYESILKSPYAEKRVATIVDRDGKTGQRPVSLSGARSAGKQLYARIQLDMETNRDWTLTGHSKPVNTAVFSPDSKRLLTGSADGTAIVWDVTTGRSMLTLKGITAAISSAVYTPNGKFIVTGCIDGAIHIWDATTGEQLRSMAGPGGRVCALDISSDGAKILSGYENGMVKVWNPSTGQGPLTFAYDNRLLSAAITPDGKSIAAGYSDATLKVWDLETQHSLLSRKIPESEGITGVHFDRNNTLYTWDGEESKDGKTKITAMTAWSIEAAKQGGPVILGIITFPIPESTVSNTVSYDTFTMLTGLFQGQAVLNNMKGGPVTLDAHDGAVAAVAISPDGTLGATGGKRNGKGEAKIWEIQSHQPAKQAK